MNYRVGSLNRYHTAHDFTALVCFAHHQKNAVNLQEFFNEVKKTPKLYYEAPIILFDESNHYHGRQKPRYHPARIAR